MSNAARVLISKYYQAQRSGIQRDAARTTVRLLESLIRLSQAHAKLLWQQEVLAHDAITAILLMESSLQTQSLLGYRPDLYEGAPSEPEEQYRTLSAQIMAKLQINPAVFETESERIVEESAELDEILCSWAPTQR
jgi:DNA helicase MCM9